MQVILRKKYRHNARDGEERACVMISKDNRWVPKRERARDGRKAKGLMMKREESEEHINSRKVDRQES